MDISNTVLEMSIPIALVCIFILLLAILIPFSPSEESLLGLGSLTFAAALFAVSEARRGCEKRTKNIETKQDEVKTTEIIETKQDEVKTTENIETKYDEIGTNDGTTTDDIIPQTRSEDVKVISSTFSTNGKEGSNLDRLPLELLGRILERVRYERIFQLKLVSKKLKSVVESNQFHALVSLREKIKLTAPYFFIENGHWQLAAFDLSLKKWRRMPTLDLDFLPAYCRPDPVLFKEFLVCSMGGLLCINFSKSRDKERLISLNPMTRKYRELPPMTYSRNPVLMHMVVDSASQSYQVIAAGSSKPGDEYLSRVTEVYDSRSNKWKKTGDLPGQAFSLNEFQTGVYCAGIIFCIGFVEENDRVSKGILGYDLEEGIWSKKWTYVFPSCTLNSTLLQLVEMDGEVFLFSERENGRSTEQYIDKLQWTLGNGDEKNTCVQMNVVQKEKIGGRSLEVYPQCVCVPHMDGHLCILDAIDHTGVVHNIRDQGAQSEFQLEALPEQGFKGELGFFSLNAMSFVIEPNFGMTV